MLKDDIEFFSKVNKYVSYPMIVSESQSSSGLMNLLNRSTMRELYWSSFYPVRDDKILVSFTINGLLYSIETMGDDFSDQQELVFREKIKREIKEIMSKKEEYYFTEIKTDELGETNRIKSIFKLSHKNKTPKVGYYMFKGKSYVMVGLNGPHLARTTIFISNSK